VSWNDVERLLGSWTLDDFSRLADRLPAIVGGLTILGLVVFLLRAPGNVRRFHEYQAQQQARRQATAARLGLEATGADPTRSRWGQALDSVVDGTEKIGPFPRLAGQSKVRILFEGEKRRFATTVLVQRISRGDRPEIPDNITTMVCFASPALNLPAFSLRPAARMPALGEAAIGAVAKVLKPLVSPGTPREEEVDFDDLAFWAMYSVRLALSGLAEGLATRDIRDVFTLPVR